MSSEPRPPGGRVRVGYWTDPLCIWAFVAEDRLERLLADFGDHLDLQHRVVPVFGSVPWRFAEGPWAKGGVEGRVAATAKIAREHGHPEVTGEVWRTAGATSSWAAGAALEAVFALAREGEIDGALAPRYQRRMRERFFVDGQNVCARGVQLALAEEVGVPVGSLARRLDDGSALARLWEDFQEKERLKILGSPTYVFDEGRAQLYGDFPYGVLRATVEELIRGAAPGASRC